MYDEVTITIGEEKLSFRFRLGDSPAAVALLRKHGAALESMDFSEEADEQQKAALAIEFGSVLFPDEETTQSVMRTVLSGPHESLTWYLDVSWIRMVAIVADWLSRTRADIRSASREEEERIQRVAARLKDEDDAE